MLSYNQETGVFIWKKISKHHNEKNLMEAGVVTGCYRVIQIDGIKIRAHRLAWFYTFGYLPVVCDHMDGNTLNNSIFNLRNVTNLQNAQNHSKVKNKIGGLPVGVKLLQSGMFQARATAAGVCYALGSYKTKEEAHERYKKFTRKRHDNPAVE